MTDCKTIPLPVLIPLSDISGIALQSTTANLLCRHRDQMTMRSAIEQIHEAQYLNHR
jgi:hypothetical protein